MTAPNKQDWLKLLDDVVQEDNRLKVPDDVFERVMAGWNRPARRKETAATVPSQRRPPTVRQTWRIGLSLAAAAALIVLLMSPWQRSGWIATVEAADGSRYTLAADAVVRSGNASGTMLTLKDGSRVEMRSESELSVERAVDGLGIRLRTGGLIVNATKQARGRLYVRTKDMTVAVVGTMFVVNAEERGSRVTVLEGEVRVREGAMETSVRPGQQVLTSPTLATRSVREEVGWSRYAPAILEAFEKGMAETSGLLQPLLLDASGRAKAFENRPLAVSPEFEEASIRPCDSNNLPQTPDNARGGGAGSLQLTPGRLNALCVTVATLIRAAHGYGPASLDARRGGRLIAPEFGQVLGLGTEDGRRVRGGPDWVRSELYTISAIASDRASADAMRGPMLQRLLERRLQLKAHIETEDVPAYALTVAKGGLKIKPTPSAACEPLPGRPGQPLLYGYPVNVLTPPRTLADVRGGQRPSCGSWGRADGPNLSILGGDIPLEGLASALGFRLGVRVFDRTGLTDRFNFALEFALDDNTAGSRQLQDLPDPSAFPEAPRAPTIFTALEEQLGLKLERTQAPREFVVIDRVERPSPN